MEINIRGMNATLAILENGDAAARQQELEEALERKPEFDYAISPLRHLEKGFEAKGYIGVPVLKTVFDALRGENRVA